MHGRLLAALVRDEIAPSQVIFTSISLYIHWGFPLISLHLGVFRVDSYDVAAPWRVAHINPIEFYVISRQITGIFRGRPVLIFPGFRIRVYFQRIRLISYRYYD